MHFSTRLGTVPAIVIMALAVSCANPTAGGGSGASEPTYSPQATASNQSTPTVNAAGYVNPVDLDGTSWYLGNTEVTFPTYQGHLMCTVADTGGNIQEYYSVVETASGYTFTLEYSPDIRRIGTAYSVEAYTDDSGKLLLYGLPDTYVGMETYPGLSPRNIDTSNIPSVQSVYLSNLAGTYELDTSHWTLTINAKLGVASSLSSYWNANVVGVEEDNGVYDMLLCHSSYGAAGSIDPGITGSEPFVSQQGLFWSHCILTHVSGFNWQISWSSTWSPTPAQALATSRDMSDTFQGPSDTAVTYTYRFYLANAVLSNGWYTVDKIGSPVATYSTTSNVPLTYTWSQLQALVPELASVTAPDGYRLGDWWYTTNSITSIESSYKFMLSSSTSIFLEEQEFYLECEELPSFSGYVLAGTYQATTGNVRAMTLTATSATLDGVTSSILDVRVKNYWDTAEQYPKEVYYKLEGDKTLYIYYYINRPNYSNNYVKVRTSDDLTAFTNMDYTGLGSMSKNLVKQ